MPKQLSINIGFVTNSSSVVYHFPRALLEDDKIQSFIRAFEIEGGYVGEEMWNRSTCSTFAVTKEQKALAVERLKDTEYGGGPSIDVEDENTVVIIYGDEYNNITSILGHMLREMCERQGFSCVSDQYN